MKAVDILRGARNRIANGWTQQGLAVTRDGLETSPVSADACKFCALGAMASVFFPSPDKFDSTQYTGGMYEKKEGRRAMNLLSDAMDELATDGLRGIMYSENTKAEEVAIYRFNDDFNTTQEKVLEAFDLAINNAKEQENGTSTGQDTGSAGEGAGRTD